MGVSNWMKNSSPYNQLDSPDLNSFMAKLIFSINLWFLV